MRRRGRSLPVSTREMRFLRWRNTKPKRPVLIDAKIGPKHVLLARPYSSRWTSLTKMATSEWLVQLVAAGVVVACLLAR